jgi:long-chain acyl-CoA synthetase
MFSRNTSKTNSSSSPTSRRRFFRRRRDYASALISIDLQAVGNWAERRGIPYGSYQELAAGGRNLRPHRGPSQVNRDLAADPHPAAQIKRFLLLHKELDADDAELTRTRKVRRRYIAENISHGEGSIQAVTAAMSRHR